LLIEMRAFDRKSQIAIAIEQATPDNLSYPDSLLAEISDRRMLRQSVVVALLAGLGTWI
jgi:hypothetical protein